MEIINYGIFSSHRVRIHIPRTDLDPAGQPKNADPRGSGSISMRYGSGSGSFYNQAIIVRKPSFLLFCDFSMTFYLEGHRRKFFFNCFNMYKTGRIDITSPIFYEKKRRHLDIHRFTKQRNGFYIPLKNSKISVH